MLLVTTLMINATSSKSQVLALQLISTTRMLPECKALLVEVLGLQNIFALHQ